MYYIKTSEIISEDRQVNLKFYLRTINYTKQSFFNGRF